jgi:hypothetical protein
MIVLATCQQCLLTGKTPPVQAVATKSLSLTTAVILQCSEHGETIGYGLVVVGDPNPSVAI